MKKNLILSCNPIVNLMLHVICCADESFPRKPIYAEKADQWLTSEEKRFFETNFKMEQTGKVSTTSSFAFLFQIPAYFSEDTFESLRQTLELMNVSPSLARMKEHFPRKQQMIDKYMPNGEQDRLFGQAFKRTDRNRILDDYSTILETIYLRSYRFLWQDVLPDMKKHAQLLTEQYFLDRDIIGTWETESNLEFPYPQFIIELADPIQSQGTSLLAERDSFSHWADLNKVFTMISHEIGTHILVQTKTLNETCYRKIFEKQTEKTLRLVEALAYLLNLKICSKLGLQEGYSKAFPKHFEIEITSLKQHWRLWESKQISATNLITKALETL